MHLGLAPFLGEYTKLPSDLRLRDTEYMEVLPAVSTTAIQPALPPQEGIESFPLLFVQVRIRLGFTLSALVPLVKAT